MIQTILSMISGVIAIYTLLCLIDIFMSWIPGLRYTAFGKFIASLCEPYLNMFSKWGFLRIGNIDFSPVISLGLLSLLSSIVSGITRTGRIYLGGILGTVIYMCWSVISSLLTILLVLVFIRWIVLLIKHGQTSYDSGWARVDELISRFSYKVSGTFIKGNMNYQKSLLVTWIVFAVTLFLGRFLTIILVNLCNSIPF